MSRPRDWSPLRSSDPVGGDADAVARLAQRYADTAEAINTAVRALREIHGSTTAWSSEAGRAFRDRTRDAEGTIEKAVDRYAGAAAALSTYARELDAVQYEADQALRRAQRADDERTAARSARARNAQQPEPDPVTDRRLDDDERAADAQIAREARVVDAAEEDWLAAGNRAADAIEDVATGDGLEDGLWDDVLDVVAVVTEIAGALSAALGVIAFVMAFIPVLAPFAALVGAAAFGLGLLSLAGNSLLYANGRAGLGDVLMDVAGVVTFGAGRALLMAGRSLRVGARGLAKPSFIAALRRGGTSARQARRIARANGVTGGGRQAKDLAGRASRNSGILPTRSEWAAAYNPRTLHRELPTGSAPVLPGGTATLPPVAAALRRAQVAERLGGTADLAGAGVDAVQLLPERPDSPVERNR